jgi:phosphotransferase system IIA component
MSRSRIELRYNLVSKCVEATHPLPLDPHEAVSLVVAIGLDTLKHLPDGEGIADQIEYYTVGGEQ